MCLHEKLQCSGSSLVKLWHMLLYLVVVQYATLSGLFASSVVVAEATLSALADFILFFVFLSLTVDFSPMLFNIDLMSILVHKFCFS